MSGATAAAAAAASSSSASSAVAAHVPRLRAQRPQWQEDGAVDVCGVCGELFSFLRRKHHCRYCGGIFCAACSSATALMPPQYDFSSPQRVCVNCANELSVYAGMVEAETLLAQYHVRTDPSLTFVQPLVDIGHRGPPFKSSYLVRQQQGHGELLLTLVDCSNAVVPVGSSNAARGAVQRLLSQLQHPFLLPVHSVGFVDGKNRAVVLRPFCAKGSLRDIIYRESPQTPFGRKYRSCNKLPLKRIARIGRQVLEALTYLNSKDYPVAHLHTGNVMMTGDNDACALSEYENSVFGLVPLYQRHGLSNADPIVVQFGLVLYECAMGKQMSLDTDLLDSAVMSACPPPVFQILRSIFLEKNPPTLDLIKTNPLFGSVALTADVRFINQEKFDSKMAAVVKAARKSAPGIVDRDAGAPSASAVVGSGPLPALASRDEAASSSSSGRGHRRTNSSSAVPSTSASTAGAADAASRRRTVTMSRTGASSRGFSFETAVAAEATSAAASNAVAPNSTSSLQSTGSTAASQPASAAAPAPRAANAPPPPPPPPAPPAAAPAPRSANAPPPPSDARSALLAAICDPSNTRRLRSVTTAN